MSGLMSSSSPAIAVAVPEVINSAVECWCRFQHPSKFGFVAADAGLPPSTSSMAPITASTAAMTTIQSRRVTMKRPQRSASPYPPPLLVTNCGKPTTGRHELQPHARIQSEADVTRIGVRSHHRAGSSRPVQTCLRCRRGFSSATPRALQRAEGAPCGRRLSGWLYGRRTTGGMVLSTARAQRSNPRR